MYLHILQVIGPLLVLLGCLNILYRRQADLIYIGAAEIVFGFAICVAIYLV